MKKLFKFITILSLFVFIGLITSCGSKEKVDEKKDTKTQENINKNSEDNSKNNKESKEEKKLDRKIVLRAVNGPTAIGFSKFVEDNTGKNVSKFEYEKAALAQEVVNSFIKGEIDMAAVPANLASTLYNKTNGNVQVASVNTLGVVYIVDNIGTIKKISDLKGKTVMVPAKGQTPEYILKDILSKSGLKIGEDVKIEYKNQPNEVAAAFNSGKEVVALLPEPFVTVVKMKNKKVNVSLDLNKIWKELNKTEIVTGVLIVNKEFAEKHKDLVVEFLEKYKSSIEFVKNNREEASKIIEKQGIVKAPVAQKALEKLNIAYLDGDDLNMNLNNYLEILFKLEPKSIGGKVPPQDFYFKK